MNTFIIVLAILLCIIIFQLYAYFKIKAKLKDSEYRNDSLLDEIHAYDTDEYHKRIKRGEFD